MAEIKAIIKGENKITSAVKAAEKDLTGFESVVKKVGDVMNTALAATAIIAGLKKVADAAKQCINEFTEAEKVSLRLEKVWDNVGSATGKSYKQIMTYADAIEKSTYFTSEAVEESALLLAATESLTEDGFERALNASADLAAALGEDMTSAASTLARALQDPETALTKLRSIGVTFTEEEKNQIKALADANQTYEAQEIILTKIESKYKDVAKAINNTPSGTLDNIRDTLGDIRENLGGALLDVISPALELVYKALLKISEWVSKARAAVAEEKSINELTSRLNKGEALEGITDDILYAALETYQRKIDTWNLRSNYAPGTYVGYIEKVNQELEDRAKALEESLSVDKIEPILIEGMNNAADALEDAIEPAFATFLTKYGNSSTSYQKSAYEAIIASAEDLRSQMTVDKNGTTYFNKDTRLAWGVETLEEFQAIYKQLGEIIVSYNKKIDDLQPKETVEPTELEKILSAYGKESASLEIKNLNATIEKIKSLRKDADAEQQIYLDEIITKLDEQLTELQKQPEKEKEVTKTFIENMTKSFSDMLAGTWQTRGLVNFDTVISDDQASAAASTLVNTAISKMGEAGDLIQNLATNMATMGPALGAIVTALQYVIEGFMEAMGPVLEEFVQYGLEPIREIGRVIADIIMPIMKDIMPSIKQSANFLIGIFDAIGAVLKPIVNFLSSFLTPILAAITTILQILEGPLKIVAKGLSAVGETLGWLGDWIRHIVATVVNWLASWIPWIGEMDDVNPGNLGDRIRTSWATIDNAFDGGADTNNSSTGTAVKNASYSGATSVTINIYQQAPVVGDGGMLQFAQMIREQFDNLAYYGV